MKRFTGFAFVLAALSCQGVDGPSDPVDDRGGSSVDGGDPTNDSASDPEIQPIGDGIGDRPDTDATPGAGMTSKPSEGSSSGGEDGADGPPPGSEPEAGEDDPSVDPDTSAAGARGDGATDGGDGSPPTDEGAGGTSGTGGIASAAGSPPAGGTTNAAGASARGGSGGAKPTGGAPGAGGAKNGGAANVAGSPPAVAGAPGAAGAPSKCTSVVTEHGVTSAEHIASCSPVKYETNPPCEGTHYDSAAAFTTYDEPIPHGFVVHSLEHGGIAVWYNCPGGCPAEVARAQAWIDALPEDVLCVTDGIPRRIMMVPNPALPTRWAASAWGWTLTAPCFDEVAFTSFYKKRYNKTSEKYCRGSPITSKTCPGLK